MGREVLKKYLTGRWIDGVRIVEILRESEKCIWIKTSWGEPTRKLKRSGPDRYHDTWEAARATLIERCKWRFQSAQDNLNQARSSLDDAIALPETEPEETP